jgi:formate dehydrogenase subunit gamma
MSAPHPAPASAAETAKAIAARHGNRPDALIEILHDLQHEIGFVPEATLPVLAKAVNLSRAEVHGVATFYHEFRRQPAGRHVVRVCQAESCQAMGSRALAAAIRSSLKIDFGQTTADGAITLEAVYCLGNCALSPAIMVDGKMVGRVDAKTFDKIAAELRA